MECRLKYYIMVRVNVNPREREVKQQARAFTPEQARSIIDMAQDPWRAMFAIAAYAGLRAGEILGLSVEDVDLTRGVLSSEKPRGMVVPKRQSLLEARARFRLWRI